MQYIRFEKKAICGYIPIDLSMETISLSLIPGIERTLSTATLTASSTASGDMTHMFSRLMPEYTTAEVRAR